MHYRFSYTFPHRHVVDVEFSIELSDQDTIELYIPAWRPGRYELQNYAKNFLKIEAFGSGNSPLICQKKDRNSWTIYSKGHQLVVVKYAYFAAQMDAGGSWLDEQQLYLNPINCCLAVMGMEHLTCHVSLPKNADHHIASSLHQDHNGSLIANSYYELIDSPIICSPSIQSIQFKVLNTIYHVHICGQVAIEWPKLQADFEQFILAQVHLFGNFPQEEYHFLIQVLPYRFYHGVEHSKSTVIVLGPDVEFELPQFYKTLLAISSHELFHAWNICKIRPQELQPYDYRKECYFPTGFVVEGFTTYYGDLMLLRCGVWQLPQFMEELNENLQKHVENQAKNCVSIYQSSIDLWVDGYQTTHPQRKVSIYDKGAVIAFLLDIELMRKTDRAQSLDSVMQALWTDHGLTDKGYSYQNVLDTINKVGNGNYADFFANYIEGTLSVEKAFAKALSYIGYSLHVESAASTCADVFGFKLSLSHDRWIVSGIAIGSVADRNLAINDDILEVNGHKQFEHPDAVMSSKNMLVLKIVRNGQILTKSLVADGNQHFMTYRIVPNSAATTEELANRDYWAKRVKSQ